MEKEEQKTAEPGPNQAKWERCTVREAELTLYAMWKATKLIGGLPEDASLYTCMAERKVGFYVEAK
jgi:hypothetical protein